MNGKTDRRSISDLVDTMSHREMWQYFRLFIYVAGAALSVAYLPTPFAVVAGMTFTLAAWVFGIGWCTDNFQDRAALKLFSDSCRGQGQEDEQGT